MSALPWLQHTLPAQTGFDSSRALGLLAIVCTAALASALSAWRTHPPAGRTGGDKP